MGNLGAGGGFWGTGGVGWVKGGEWLVIYFHQLSTSIFNSAAGEKE